MELRGDTPLEAASSEERKLTTLLFADLVGSTALGAGADPERTRLLLERFYDAMAGEIEAVGGTVEKFIGDAVMAAFGAPAAQEDHAERALHGALAMRRRLAELFGERLSLRIGVNTGEVVLGRAREGSSFVTGDAVNAAARLEQAAGPGEILVGERTVAAVRGAFEFAEPTTVEAKGKPEGVACRLLLGAVSLTRPRGVRGLRPAFVGRDSELELLQATYHRVAEQGSPHLVTILGEPGAGKTRLAGELWEWLGAQSRNPLRRTGRCVPYGQGITYWPLGEILKEHFSVLRSDPPEKLRLRLGQREILGLALGLDVGGDLHPRAARDRFHQAWVDFLDELVSERPAVILVEDLHWAEDELLDLLERLLRHVQGPMLLLCTARPELLRLRPGWGGARRAASTLELEPLSSEDSGRMLEALLGFELPTQLRPVVEHAGGNPFFIEELLAGLIDKGVVAEQDGGWTVGHLPLEVRAPDTVQAVVAARIDLLAPADKAALQAASVMGRVFWAGPLYELLPEADTDFDALEDRDFIRRRSDSTIAGETEFAFKHQLTREVAYDSLPKSRRAHLHGAFAAWLERVSAEQDEHASRLAHGYAQAVRPEDADLVWAGAEDEFERLRQKAVMWLRRAGELAGGRYEVKQALALFEHALALEVDDRAKSDLLREIGHLHMLGYEPERFRQVMEQALGLHPERAVAAKIYAELAHYGRGRAYMWKQPPPAELGERWLDSALELAEPRSEARVEALLARAFATPEAGAEAADEALALAESLGLPRFLAYAYEAQALVASMQGRFEEACAWADRGLGALPSISDPDVRAHQYWQAGFVYLRGGRVADVPPLAEEYDRLAAPLTAHHEVHAVALHGLLQSAVGRWQALVELGTRAEAVAEANEETPCMFNWRSLLVCALGLEHAGQTTEARRLEERACERALVGGPPEIEPALLRLALLRGDLVKAERILDRLPASGDPWGLDAAAARLDALAALGDRTGVEREAAPFVEGVSYTRPFALRALGRVRGERRLVEQAVSRFEAMGLEGQARETRSLLESGMLSAGRRWY